MTEKSATVISERMGLWYVKKIIWQMVLFHSHCIRATTNVVPGPSILADNRGAHPGTRKIERQRLPGDHIKLKRFAEVGPTG